MTATLGPYRALLRLRHVRELFWAACLSRLAGRMFLLAIVLYALGRFHSPVIAGWLSFASIAPGLVLSPLSGALLDRIGAARAIALDMAASATLLLLLALGGLAGLVGLPGLFVLVTLISLTSPLSSAGIRALIPELVTADALDLANAVDTGSYELIDVAGPALAGLLMGFAGADATMAVIAVLALLAVLSLLPLARRPVAERAAPPVAPVSALLGEAIAGLVHVVRHRSLRGLAVSYALYQAAWGILAVAVPVLVAQRLRTPGSVESAVGLLWAGAGLAGVCGALLAGHWRTIERERQFIVLGLLATALAVAAIGAVGHMLALALGLAVVGACAGPVDVAVLSLRQRRTDPRRLGRVLAISMSLNMCGLPAGAALGGMLASGSTAIAFLAAAAVAALAAVAAFVLLPERAEA